MRSVVAKRLLASLTLLAGVMLAGSTAFWAIGAGRWRWFDCLYFTVVTLGTIGYGETLPGFETVPYARAFTMLLILAGTGVVVYVASNATALIVEGDLREALRVSRQRRAAARLSDHVILCGAGRTGIATLQSLRKAGRDLVVVDMDPERVLAVREDHPGVHVFEGDASSDDVLRDLGIARASGFVVALGDDRATLFTVLSARALNPSVRIVARATEGASVSKLERAGADRVVFETSLAGMRMASEMVRPTVVNFIDAVLRDPDHPMQFAELPVVAGSRVVGRTLGALQLRRHADVIVLAVRTPDGRHHFNPNHETVLAAQTVLMTLGEAAQIDRARAFLAEAEAREPAHA